MTDLILDLQRKLQALYEADNAEFEAIKAASNVGSRSASQKLADDPFFDIVEQPTDVPGRGKASKVSHPFLVTFSGTSVTVNENSLLFEDITMASNVSISGLGTPLAASTGADVWIAVNFGTWPAVASAAISVGSFPGEVEDTGGADPVQTVARKMIATITGGGDVIQIVNTNLYMVEFPWNGMAISFPRA